MDCARQTSNSHNTVGALLTSERFQHLSLFILLLTQFSQMDSTDTLTTVDESRPDLLVEKSKTLLFQPKLVSSERSQTPQEFLVTCSRRFQIGRSRRSSSRGNGWRRRLGQIRAKNIEREGVMFSHESVIDEIYLLTHPRATIQRTPDSTSVSTSCPRMTSALFLQRICALRVSVDLILSHLVLQPALESTQDL